MSLSLISQAKGRIETVKALLGEKLIGQILAGLRAIALIAILLFLIYRLSEIGWMKIYESRPTSPLFYLLSAAMFMVLPLTDIVNYRIMTGQKIPSALKVFCRKQVLNEAVVSYAGETYLCPKLAALPGHDTKKALIAIKDNTLISALVSNSWTILLVLYVWLFGHSDVLRQIWNISPVMIGAFGIFCILLYMASLFFFRKLIGRDMASVWKIGAMHGLRIIVLAGLQVAQWQIGLPADALTIWIMFLAVQTLVKRVPVNGDLMFLGVALAIPGFNAGEESVVAMLVAAAAINQFVQFCAFILTSDFKWQTSKMPVLQDKASQKELAIK